MKINIFVRKKSSSNQNSVERYARILKQGLDSKNFKVNIIECPLVSKGLFRRIYLILWAYFNQGNVNHILGDVNFISLLMNKKKTINTFLDCRLLNEFSGLKRTTYKFLWFSLPIKSSIINTFISNFTKREIEKKLNKKIINSFVIPVPLIDNLSFKINKNKKKKILIVGTLPHKNVKNMILGITGLNVNLTIVGEVENSDKLLLKKNKINYKNYVKVSSNKIKNLYTQNDILLMASKYEGFGMPIIEAQASGAVVITSNKEPMKSVAGKYGEFVNPYKPKEIKKSIKKIIKNKKLFLKIIKNGRYNSSKYKSNIILKKYKEIYLKIIKNEN